MPPVPGSGAINGAFFSCGINRVYYLCSCGHKSCVFLYHLYQNVRMHRETIVPNGLPCSLVPVKIFICFHIMFLYVFFWGVGGYLFLFCLYNTSEVEGCQILPSFISINICIYIDH